jgi:hypothetical protein
MRQEAAGNGAPHDPQVIEAATSGTDLPLTGAGIVVREISDDAQADGNGRAQSAPTKAERAAKRRGGAV